MSTMQTDEGHALSAQGVGWYRDSDGLGERYWNGAAWQGFRTGAREWGVFCFLVIWLFGPAVTFLIAIHRASTTARLVLGAIALASGVFQVRALRCQLTVTPQEVTDRGVIRSRRYRLVEIEDAFFIDSGRRRPPLTLRLADGSTVTVGGAEGYRPSSLRACALAVRSLLPRGRATRTADLVRPLHADAISARRARAASEVPKYLRGAGLIEPAPVGPGGLMAESVLVFVTFGLPPGSAFDVFDQHAKCIGSAAELDVENVAAPYSWRFELRDLDGNCVLTCRVLEAARGFSGSRTHVVCAGNDDAEIAVVGPATRGGSSRRVTTRNISAQGAHIGRLGWTSIPLRSPHAHVEDTDGRPVARLKTSSDSNAHVIDIRGSIADPLRAVAILAGALTR